MGCYQWFSFPLILVSFVLRFLLLKKLNHKVGQTILAAGPCTLGKQTLSTIFPLILLGILFALVMAEQRFSKPSGKRGWGSKQDDMHCTNTPSEHQPCTIAALQSALCAVVTVVQCRKGREPAAKSGGLHSIPRHKDNWQEKKKERESFIRKKHPPHSKEKEKKKKKKKK